MDTLRKGFREGLVPKINKFDQTDRSSFVWCKKDFTTLQHCSEAEESGRENRHPQRVSQAHAVYSDRKQSQHTLGSKKFILFAKCIWKLKSFKKENSESDESEGRKICTSKMLQSYRKGLQTKRNGFLNAGNSSELPRLHSRSPAWKN